MTVDRRVLALCTNHDTYPTRPDRTGLWLSELVDPWEVLQGTGCAVDVASPNGGAVPLDERSLKRPNLTRAAAARRYDQVLQAALADSIPAGAVDPAGYAAIYLTGGHGVMWDFREPVVAELVSAFWSQGKLVSAVCHGPGGLLDATGDGGRPLVADRAVTGFTNLEERLSRTSGEIPFSLEDELRDRGARYQRAVVPFAVHVVRDGRLLTGQNPRSARRVGEQLAGLLAPAV